MVLHVQAKLFLFYLTPQQYYWHAVTHLLPHGVAKCVASSKHCRITTLCGHYTTYLALLKSQYMMAKLFFVVSLEPLPSVNQLVQSFCLIQFKSTMCSFDVLICLTGAASDSIRSSRYV